ncbi:MAG: bifunctional heptose 7-phosphate kinase/heptose 1-phosphate adenyltransferase [Ignavibacteria bacterium]
MNKSQLIKTLDKASKKKICVIGDIMLDLYMLGNVSRISPEAPVQVFDLIQTEPKLGGAANVSLNIKSLGVEPILIGVVGDDAESQMLRNLLIDFQHNAEGLIVEKHRKTTCKTRVISSSHHLIRIDSETREEITPETHKKVMKYFCDNLNEFDTVIIEDYNKGLLTRRLIKDIVSVSNKNKKKVLVDPKFYNFFEYKNVFVFKPNKKEIEDAFGKKNLNDGEIEALGKEVLKKIKCENLVVTLGNKGMKIFQVDKGKVKINSLGTKARKVADVSGAGDTVISTLGVCLTGGASVNDAVAAANIAAGLVVEEVGIVPICREVLVSNFDQL